MASFLGSLGSRPMPKRSTRALSGLTIWSRAKANSSGRATPNSINISMCLDIDHVFGSILLWRTVLQTVGPARINEGHAGANWIAFIFASSSTISFFPVLGRLRGSPGFCFDATQSNQMWIWKAPPKNRIVDTRSRLCWSAAVPCRQLSKAAVESVRISNDCPRRSLCHIRIAIRTAKSSACVFRCSFLSFLLAWITVGRQGAQAPFRHTCMGDLLHAVEQHPHPLPFSEGPSTHRAIGDDVLQTL